MVKNFELKIILYFRFSNKGYSPIPSEEEYEMREAQRRRIEERRAVVEECRRDLEAAERALDDAQRELSFVREVGGGFWAPEIEDKKSEVSRREGEVGEARRRLADAESDLRNEECWAI